MLEDSRRLFKDSFLSTNANKSESELRDIIDRNCKIILKLPTNPTAQDLANATKLQGEVDACQELLEQIKEKREVLKGKSTKTKNDREGIMRASALNSKAGADPNAHLVLAILEEEGGKTLNELNGWCEELISLDEAGMKNLLDGMLKDEVIFKSEDDQMYYFRTNYTKKMIWEESAVKRYLIENYGVEDEEEEALWYLIHLLMDVDNTPISKMVITEKMRILYEDKLLGFSEKTAEEYVKERISEMLKANIITIAFVGHDGSTRQVFYAPVILGGGDSNEM